MEEDFFRKNADLREIIAKGQSIEDFRTSVIGLRDRFIQFHKKEAEYIEPEELKIFNLNHPPWICQPYVRPPPEVYLEKMRKIAAEEKREREEQNKSEGDNNEENKRSAEEENDDAPMSKTKRKKMEKKAQKDKWKAINQMKIDYQACNIESCNNPCSKKCPYLICRQCCKKKSEQEIVVCDAHKIYVRSLDSKKSHSEKSES